MAFGDYILVMEERTGVELARLTMNAEAGSRPITGEEVTVRGQVYAVVRVRHVPDPHDTSARDATVPAIYVRSPIKGQGSPSSGPGPSGHSRKATVLKFTPPATSRLTTSFLLPPQFIVAILHVAYSRQEKEYRRAQGTYYLAQDGDHQWCDTDIVDGSRLSGRASAALAALATFNADYVANAHPTGFAHGFYAPTIPPEASRSLPTLNDAEGHTQNDRPPGKPLPKRAPAPELAPPSPPSEPVRAGDDGDDFDAEATRPEVRLRLVKDGA